MISKKVAVLTINEALSTGGDYAEIYYEDSKTDSIVVENGKVSTVASACTCGVGLRILKGNRCVFGYTNDLSKKGLISLASDLSKCFDGERVLTISGFSNIKYKNRNPIKDSFYSHTHVEKIALLKEGVKEIESINNPKIVRTQCGFSNKAKIVEVFNSKSKHFVRKNEYGKIVFLVLCLDQNGMEMGFVSKGNQIGYNSFVDINKIKELARNAAESALLMLDAKPCPSGKMPVVVGNGDGGVLFHEACGHPLESTSVSKNLSPFSGKVGQLVASPLVSAVDDATIPGAWGSIDIDDEGNVGCKKVLIKNGVLQNYMIDDFTGRRMNKEGNGSSRRQSYKYSPVSRMTNTYICNGKSTKEEIIKATKLGLYAVSFKGGQVDPTTGEFNFSCNEAYVIRDGKVCEAVKGAMLIGKGDEILKKIDMVGNDLELSDGSCGAASGSINVCVGQPTIRISEITVGGTGGELK